MSQKCSKALEDDLTTPEPNEGRLRLELRKLTNSEGWMSTPRHASGNSSRASTPLSHDSAVPRRGRPPKKLEKGKKKADVQKSSNGSSKSKASNKPKKFRMVLEKDDDYEIDYLTPDEVDSSSSSVDNDDISDDASMSDGDFYLGDDDDDSPSVKESTSPMLVDEDDVDDEEIPDLKLPESSNDLLVDNKQVLQALAVYEVLRHFRNILRLSPFLFEDFCAALAANETTVLMNECHITLLKTLLKEEESTGTLFVPVDQKDACNANLYFIDYLTWPEVLRAYLESSLQCKSVIPILEDKDYPNVVVSQKLAVLHMLTNMLLSSARIRDELMMDGTIRYDDHCRACHRLGDLLCCETCPAVYHLSCCNPPLKEVPDDEWQCEICIAHKLNGVSDCEAETEMAGQYLRHCPIGVDRHGRKYWFLVRRLFVEGPDDVRYYTTYDEFKHVLSKLDHERYEMVLCEALKDVLEEFPRQSRITEDLTNESRWKDEGKTAIEIMKEKTKTLVKEKEEKRVAEEKRIAEEQRLTDVKKMAEERIEIDNQINAVKGSINEQSNSNTTFESDTTPQNDDVKGLLDIDKDPPVKKLDTTHREASSKHVESLVEVYKSAAQDVLKDNFVPIKPEENSTNVVTTAFNVTASKENVDLEVGVSDAKMPSNKTIGHTNALPVLAVAAEEQKHSNIPFKAPKLQNETAISMHQPSQTIDSSVQPVAHASTITIPLQQKPIIGQPQSMNISGLPRNTLIPLNLKVPLTRCDALINSNNGSKLPSTSALKIGQKIQLKPGATAAPMTTFKNLFVLSKDGVRTPLTIGPEGKLVASTNQKLVMINSGQQQNKTFQQQQSKLSRELRRLQFTGAGPKMQKIVSLPGMKNQSNNTPNLENVSEAKTSTATPPSPKIVKPPPKEPFRLGEDDGYKQYKNYFVENTLALNKYQHKEEKDKDRHVGYKFSLTGPVEFEWPGLLCGTRDEIVHSLRSALFLLEQEIPLCFMHSKWDQYRKMWGHMLVKNDSTKAFAVVLGILEMAIRNHAKKTVWREGMGQVRMRRVTPTEKELYEKKKKLRLKIEEDVASRNAVWCKYPLPVKNNLVLKIKGEEYRTTGYGGWMWLSCTFRLRRKKAKIKAFTLFRTGPSNSTNMTTQSTNDNQETAQTAIDETQQTCASELPQIVDDFAKEIKAIVDVCDVVNVSKHLLVRSVVYNRRWATSKVDKLLRWRILQEKERLMVAEKTKLNPSESKAIVQETTSASENITSTHVAKSDVEGSNCLSKASVISPSFKSQTENDKSKEKLTCENPDKQISLHRDDAANSYSFDKRSVSLEEPEISDDESVAVSTNNRVATPQLDTYVSSSTQVSNIVTPSTQTDILYNVSSTQEKEIVSVSEPINEETKLLETNEPSVLISNDSLKTSPALIINASGDGNNKNEDTSLSIDNFASADKSKCGIVSTSENTMKVDHQPELVFSSANSLDPLTVDVGPTELQASVTVKSQTNDFSDMIVCNGKVPDPESHEKVTSTMIKTTTEEAVTTVTSHTCGNTVVSTVSKVTTVQTAKTTIISSATSERTLISSTPSKDINITENVYLNAAESKPGSNTSSCMPDKLESHSYDGVSKSSTEILDHLSGNVSTTSCTSKISRRFRSCHKANTTISHSFSSEVQSSLAKVWKLVKSPADASNMKKNSDIKMPLPWKFSVGKERRKSIFRLPRSCVKYMAIRGGLAWYPLGFKHVQKSPTSLELFWPYRCVRPTIGTAWRFKLQNATTLASIAHLLRVLWHSIRWDDIVTGPTTDDVIHTVHNDDDIVSIELLKRRNVGVTGLRSEYFVRRIIMPTSDYDEEIPRSEAYTPSSRSGLRTRGRQMNLRERTKKDVGLVEPKVETLWLPEDKIQLWQIRQFDAMIRSQQKAAAKREADEVKAKAAATPPTKRQMSIREALNSLNNAEKSQTTTATNTKQVTISPALLKQAAALHRTQGSFGQNDRSATMPKLIAVNSASQKVMASGTFPVKFSDGATVTTPGHFQTITLKSPSAPSPQYVSVKPSTANVSSTPTSGGSTIIQTSTGQTFLRAAPAANQFVVHGNRVLQRKILVKPGPTASDQAWKTRHPTIKLGGVVVPPKVNQQLTSSAPQAAASAQSQASSAKLPTSMQVKLSASQLAELMKVGMGSVVKVPVTMADGKPGMGQLQMIAQGVQVTPTPGQQVMQCKVGNDIRRFLLTALADEGKAARSTSEQVSVDSEVTLKTPSLRHRLEQLQHRPQDLLKSKQSSTNVHRLMTDKDPLWGGRTTQAAEKVQSVEKMAKKEPTEKPAKKKVYYGSESREERQRKTVVQQVLKSMLDRIERKEEVEARRKRREENLEMQKRKRESLDVAKSQQRLHHRLLQALIRHEEHIKQEIRKRRTITEKYLTKMVENELYEDRLKLKRRKHLPSTPIEALVAKQPKKSNYMTTSSALSNILTESNKKVSPKKIQLPQQQRSARKRTRSTEEKLEAPDAPKKKKMINRSSQLYCICKTPYDDTRFYIGCDLCMNWFHGSCVGISEKKAKSMENWVCKDCDKEQSTPQQELYCLCKTPYDDAQFYIGCDVCQDWYHGRCVGISEEEASSIESYTCPRCKAEARDASFEETLAEREISALTKIIRQLQSHKMAWPFLEPVREADAPGYYKVVKRPMDLQTVMKRLNCRFYMKLSELVGDVSLIFDNCRQYNGADSKIVRCAEIVETVFVGKIRDMRGR